MNISNSATVHIVDDDDAVRDSFRSLLESHGLTVRDYASADDFLADRQQQRTGCLLLDVHMPGMTGLELLGKVREDRSHLPVIAITGRSDSTLKRQLARVGAFALLEKPTNAEVLLWTIESAVAAQPPAR
jgi:two-component system, LuxR family, response regulator FixJ